MAPIKLRTYSRRQPRRNRDRELVDTNKKTLGINDRSRPKRKPLKPRHKQQSMKDFVSKTPCNLYNALFGVNSNSVNMSKASMGQGSPEVFLRQEASESSFYLSVDSTFDKLLKGKSVKPANVPIGVMNHMENEVLPMYPALPYSLEIHTDEELPSSFFKIPSKVENDKMSSRNRKLKNSLEDDLNQMKLSTLPSTRKRIKPKVERSPHKCSYELRPRSRTHYYLSRQKRNDGTCSLSSSSSLLKTSTMDDSELFHNQENMHPFGQECSHIYDKSRQAATDQLTTRDTSTPLKASKQQQKTANISFLSPISFIENSITDNLVVLASQEDTNCVNINDSTSPISSDAKQIELSHETDNILPSNSTEPEETDFEMPFKGWSPNIAHKLNKVLLSIAKFEFSNMSAVDQNESPDFIDDTYKTTCLELNNESKESHRPLAENTSNNSIPFFSNTNDLPASAESDVLLPKEEIIQSNTEAAPGSEPEFTAQLPSIIATHETDRNAVMSAGGHRLQWCTQPLLLEDDGTLDPIEEDRVDEMPFEQLPRDSYFKRFKRVLPTQHTSLTRASVCNTPTHSFRTSSICGKASHRKSRMSHIVIPGKVLAQPKPESRSFRDLHGITEIEPDELLPLSRDLDGSFHKGDSDPIRLTCTKEDPAITARNVVLQRCRQDAPVPFSEAFSDTYLNNCRKIGEGVYGEVFMWQDGSESAVLKIIPIEGEDLVNGERQKQFSEILSEIVITTELSNLRLNCHNQTNGFTEVIQNWCVQDKYPEQLIRLWKQYAEEKHSENDCPDVFSESQLFIVLVLANGGQDLEQFQFNNAKQSKSILLQTAYALAVAEQSLEFEHRDLHWGNVLISRTKEKSVTFILDSQEHSIPTHGVQVTIIDFTLSRMTYDGCCIFNDLSQDPGLFESHGDYQFDIYRSMRETCSDNWNEFVPFTNVSWLHYLVDKMTASAALGVHYHNTKTKVHLNGLKVLKQIKSSLLSFTSSVKFVQSLDIKMRT